MTKFEPPPWSVEGIGRDACPQRSSAKEFRSLKREAAVKAFLAACLAAIVLAAISWVVLNFVQEPADEAFATPPYTRIGAMTESGHELFKLSTTEAVTAWTAVAALFLAVIAAVIAYCQVRETRNSGKEADAQESFRSYLELALNNPNLARPDLYKNKMTPLDRKKYEWFVAYLLAASEKILASVDDPEWKETIKLNISYHKEFLSDINALKESEFEMYAPDLQNLVREKTGRPRPQANQSGLDALLRS
jgi:hypothetical protein